MVNKKEVLQQFKARHPKLVKLKPKIWIDQLTEKSESLSKGRYRTTKYDPPIDEINVAFPFMFDLRLIPKSFKGIRVRSHPIGTYPKEFPDPNAALPMEEYIAPEFYRAFVSNNLEKIREKLKSPIMSEEEALDALTGDFNEHIKWCIKMKEERTKKSKKEIAFFHALQDKTKIAYEQSEIKKNGWGFSVTATYIHKNSPLIVGFNWGVDSQWLKEGNKYSAGDQEYPFRFFEGNYEDLGSLKRTINYFHDYFPKGVTAMQTNFCFFRSEKESQISQKDLELSTPLFDEYVKFSTPSIIISFSKKLLTHLEKTGRLSGINTKSIKSGKKTICPVKATFNAEGKRRIDFVYLQHPNSPVTKEARDKAWEFAFGGKV